MTDQRGVQRWFLRRLPTTLGLAAAATACAAAAPLQWFLELFSHFTPHWAAATFVLAVAFVALEAPRWAFAAIVVTVANILLVVLNFVPPKEPNRSAAGPRLGILHLNVNLGHSDPRRVVDYVLNHADRFDVLVLIETAPAWTSELKRLEQTYPHSVLALEDSPWGIAVFSKVKPLENIIVEAPDGVRHSEMRIALPGRARPVTIYGLHPAPPITALLAGARNAKLDEIARRVRSHSGESAIVVGDFNLTPYSPYFQRFSAVSGLRPARGGALASSTWPGSLAAVWLGIPIDHTFVAPDVDVFAHGVGPNLGSDHLPVEVTLALR